MKSTCGIELKELEAKAVTAVLITLTGVKVQQCELILLLVLAVVEDPPCFRKFEKEEYFFFFSCFSKSRYPED